MTETTTAPPIHWSAIETGDTSSDLVPPTHTKDQLAVQFAAMATAHLHGYRTSFHDRDNMTPDGMRTAIDRHLHPALAAFAAAAALKGWEADLIESVSEEGSDTDEWCLQWLSEAGITDDIIRRLSADLNAPDVITDLTTA